MSTQADLSFPSGRSFVEASLRRNLQSCEAITRAIPGSEEYLDNWKADFTFHYDVHTLEDQLEELKAERGAERNAIALEAYASRIHALKSMCHPASTPGADMFPPLSVEPMAPLYPGHVPQPPPAIPSSPAPSGRTGSLPPAHSTFVPGTKQNDPNAALHEAMTDELADMAAALKSSTLAVENQVRLRGDVLNSTEDKLDKSVAGVGSAKRRTGEIHAARKWGFCFTLMLIFLLSFAVVAMYAFIKVTSFAGYRATPRVIVVPATPVPPGMDHGEL